jgi:GAF domain-containing protein
MAIDWSAADGDSSALAHALEELTEMLVAEEPVSVVLERVTELACAAIPGCDIASVTTMNDEMFETIAYTHQDALEIDQAQYAVDRGPCLYAFRRREVVSVPSIREGTSYENFRSAALEHGVESSFSLPMATGGVRVGALNLYSRRDHAFNSVPPAAAALFAKQATAAIWATRTQASTRGVIAHLEAALETRELIGMAKGVIMANEKVTSDEAFGLLVTASQHRNVKLRDVAHEVVETGVSPIG